MPGPKFRPKAGNKFADTNDLAYLKIKDSAAAERKAAAAARREAEKARQKEKAADFDLQQATLNVFKNSFGSILDDAGGLATLLQEVKQALFNRDFDRAFGKEEYLEAYAARWSPTRALGYEAVLRDVDGQGFLDGLYVNVVSEKAEEDVKVEAEKTEGERIEEVKMENLKIEDVQAEGEQTEEELEGEKTETDSKPSAEASSSATQPATPPPTRTLRLLSIGGGAAELVAFASFLGRGQPTSTPQTETETTTAGEILLVDSAPWSGVVDKLYGQLTVPPPLYKYAGAAARAANRALMPRSHLRPTFAQHDVLALSKDELAGLVGSEPTLITLLFTLNELFSQAGIGPTTKFLLDMTAVSQLGTTLLVVDSPGSYSETTVGKASRKYPMQWLMDKVLSSVEGERRWEKLASNDSLWYRLADGMEYPIQLENMRYQMHLYRLVAGKGTGAAEATG